MYSVFILLIFGCTTHAKNELTLGDCVDIEKISKVRMQNNMGDFDLSDAQLEKFKSQISTLTYEPNMAVKLGPINVTLTIADQEYMIVTGTHSDFVEIDHRMIIRNKEKVTSDFFRNNGINFDNYKEE